MFFLLLFAICMIGFIWKLFVFGVRASWGIMKLLCTVVLFPVILIYTIPFTGLYQLNLLVLLFLSLFLLCLDFVLLVSLPRRFTAENLL